MMPILNLLILLGLLAFYFMEKVCIYKFESTKKASAIQSIRMIYLVSLVGFLVAQPLSIGNAKIILAFYETFSLNEAKVIVAAVVDYTSLFVLLMLNLCVLCYYSDRH